MVSKISFIPKNKGTAKPKSFLPSKNLVPKSHEEKPEKARLIPRLTAEQIDQAKRSRSETIEKAPPKEVLSLDNLKSAQSAALAALSPNAAVALKEVWDAVASSKSGHSQLLELLENGTLGQNDGNSSVVEQLRDLASTPRASGFDNQALTSQTVALLADPESSIFQGEDRYTCGAANLQHMLTDQPSLLIQTVEGLSSPEGIAPLAAGAEMKRPANTSQDDGSGRNDVDRLLQGALMSFAGENKGAYDVLSDTFSNGEKALRSLEIARAVAHIQGEDQAVLAHDSSTSKMFHKLVKETPPGERIQIGAYWEEQDHMLLLLEQVDGQAKFFNPQTKSISTMPVDDLLYKAQLAIFPATRVEGYEAPPEKLYFAPMDKKA